MSPINSIEFSSKLLNYNSGILNKVNYLWWNKTSDTEKKEGMKAAGYVCDISQANFYIKKAALKALGKIK